MSTHLIVPDCHIKEGDTPSRFIHLAKLVLDLMPEHVICLGDFHDMAALFKAKKVTTEMMNDVMKEIDVGDVIQDEFFRIIKARKRKQPKFWMIRGNHDVRIDMLDDPPDPFHPKWEVIDYEGTTPGRLHLDGVTYSHYAISGLYGSSLTSNDIGANLLAKHHTSYTVGHSHILDYSTTVSALNKRLHGLCAGVFTESSPEWAGLAANLWWRGVVHKTDVEDGDYDLNLISMKNLKEEYD